MHSFLFLLMALTAGVQVREAKSFDVTARRFTFEVSPAEFEVNQGDEVTIVLTAADDGTSGSGHGFGMEHYVPTPAEIHPGGSATIQFTADEAGSFIYFCTRVCGEGHNDMIGTFTVHAAPSQTPSIASFEPGGGPAEGGTAVTINGSQFVAGAGVTFGDTPAGASVVSATKIIATSPPHEPGDVAITVTNPGGLSATSGQLFTYEAPVLAITRVTPTRGSTAGGTSLRIDGAAFAAGATVTIGGRPARNVNVATANVLFATTPVGPHDIGGASAQEVVVRNPDGTTAALAGGFTWELPALSLASALPVRGVAGTAVTIRGAGFSTATNLVVRFGGVPSTNLQVVDAVTLIAVAPPHAQGKVDVVVSAANGTATAAGAFTYEANARRRAVRH